VAPAQASSRRSGGGNAKYVVLGLLLLAGAYGFWLFLQPPEPAPAPPPPPKPEEPERANPLATPEFELEPEPEPEPAKPATTKVRIRYIPGAWECSGDIDRKAAARLVATNKRQVTTCYERRLKMNNVLQGNLRLRIKVGSTGSVVATAVSGTLNDQEVYRCVRNLAKNWNFPPPEGGKCAIVEAPFNFTPRKD
jgi:hypothetical protein